MKILTLFSYAALLIAAAIFIGTEAFYHRKHGVMLLIGWTGCLHWIYLRYKWNM